MTRHDVIRGIGVGRWASKSEICQTIAYQKGYGWLRRWWYCSPDSRRLEQLLHRLEGNAPLYKTEMLKDGRFQTVYSLAAMGETWIEQLARGAARAA